MCELECRYDFRSDIPSPEEWQEIIRRTYPSRNQRPVKDDMSDGCVDAGTISSTCVSPVNLLLSNLDQRVQSTSAKADVHSDFSLCHSISPVPSLTPPSPSSLTVPSVSAYHENSGQPRRRPPPPPPPLRSNAVNTTAPTASTRHARCEDSSKTLLAAGSQHGADTAASVTRESVGDGSSIHAVGEGDMDNNLSLD
ncbi:hypothetical protein GBAR_LOCUS12851 [Geodia barretti]|uniref:Uncharacterized protein n=1 Tax=Geodia barretti TaxID=519541 RepID=A0AA35S353_GEOBA|nr:hypothetical protein GBAR_LOCUS12851 [Geodia barretti]